MKKKYIVCPGNVRSKSDGDLHYISASKLMMLYRVNPAECIIVEDEMVAGSLNWEDYIILKPSTDGNYSMIQIAKL